MKKIIILLFSLILLTVTFATAQTAAIYYRFNNLTVIPGVPDNLQFDVEIKSDQATNYLTGAQFGFYYNNAGLGTPTSVTAIGLLAGKPYTVFPTPNGANGYRVAVFTGFPIMAANMSLVGLTYQGLLRVTMPIIDANQLAGISWDVPYMTGYSSYVYEPVPPFGPTIPFNPFYYETDLVSLPLDPNLDLMISELGAPSDSPDNFVEIYNAGSSSVNFDSYYPWYLNIDGTSSIKLTGTLAAGESHIVNLVGATPGASEYLLTIYGNYMTGTSIDTYDGTMAGYDFTGKHAVRHFDIISPNTTFTPSEWVLSAAQDIDMTAGSHRVTLNWNGFNDEWRSQSNWAESFIPDAGHNVLIPNAGEPIPVISFGDNAFSHDLTIGGSGIGLVIESGEFIGDGSLITYGTLTGTASVQRFLKADRFWYVTQPVTSSTANVFLHTWLFTYNESSSNWDPFIEDETTPLNMMKGYAVWTSSVNSWHAGWDPMGDTTTAFDGVLNSGAISVPLTAGGNGWNFVGNPYVSAVNWEANGWTKTSLLTNSYSVWDGSTYGTYTAGSGGTNGTTKYIPAAQGFFVQANAAGSLGVTNAVRAHDAMPFWKSDENMLNRLSLTISDGEINDETVIYFNDDASADLDYAFDALKLLAPAAPQLYTMLANERMAINTFNNPVQTNKVILGVNAPVEGEYTITASNIESFNASTPIYLEDLLTGQKISLRELSSYTFNSGEGTSERFAVHFADYQGIGDKPGSEVNSIYAVNLNIYVNFIAENGVIAIYNILGQEINRTDATNGLNVISVPQGNAVYIVKVISDNTTVTKKVFVK